MHDEKKSQGKKHKLFYLELNDGSNAESLFFNIVFKLGPVD